MNKLKRMTRIYSKMVLYLNVCKVETKFKKYNIYVDINVVKSYLDHVRVLCGIYSDGTIWIDSA